MTQFPNQPDAGHNPYAGGGYDDGSAGDGRNTLGLVGFIVSLASIITCCSIAPLGLLLSFLGLFKAPRGLAIAGTIIGGVFSLIFLLGTVFMIAFWSMIEQGAVVGATEIEVRSFANQNGRLPDATEYDALLQSANMNLPGFIQPNMPFAYDYQLIDANTYEVTLGGVDGQLGTHDDVPQRYTVYYTPQPPAVPQLQQPTP